MPQYRKPRKIIVNCPRCSIAHRVPALSGIVLGVRCPTCQHRFYVDSDGATVEGGVLPPDRAHLFLTPSNN